MSERSQARPGHTDLLRATPTGPATAGSRGDAGAAQARAFWAPTSTQIAIARADWCARASPARNGGGRARRPANPIGARKISLTRWNLRRYGRRALIGCRAGAREASKALCILLGRCLVREGVPGRFPVRRWRCCRLVHRDFWRGDPTQRQGVDDSTPSALDAAAYECTEVLALRELRLQPSEYGTWLSLLHMRMPARSHEQQLPPQRKISGRKLARSTMRCASGTAARLHRGGSRFNQPPDPAGRTIAKAFEDYMQRVRAIEYHPGRVPDEVEKCPVAAIWVAGVIDLQRKADRDGTGMGKGDCTEEPGAFCGLLGGCGSASTVVCKN
ncbi:hypothetical protein WOLCODRAFT_166186 [Wolfiporia cocos MD-104 SS10]|uniref:Uncharacterized protein n=1 Tax=Wolfiporia cocos (strain MD-104) TaxID=742152 RepID=A0A2H3IZ77_WOLCO|nr:hypothetical protein WOLCODRAFT_166186 [Wolfiporia cocos MD-104 SS10]